MARLPFLCFFHFAQPARVKQETNVVLCALSLSASKTTKVVTVTRFGVSFGTDGLEEEEASASALTKVRTFAYLVPRLHHS
jgi:hypothetical protein